MASWIETLDRELSRCWHCAAWPVTSGVGICAYCAKILEFMVIDRWVSSREIKVLSLYSLRAPITSRLVIRGKGNHRKSYFQTLARNLMRQRLRRRPELSRFPKIYFTCAPTREQPRDQAERLMLAVAEFFPQAGIIPLKRTDAEGQAQKFKAKADRGNLRFVEVGHKAPEALYVFIDDVVTTGATASAAYLALGNPENFEAWTICHRPLLQSRQPV